MLDLIERLFHTSLASNKWEPVAPVHAPRIQFGALNPIRTAPGPQTEG